MREVSATEAARGFSALLTAVEERGETFLVTRAGRVVARIEPANGTSGKAVKGLLRHYPADPGWLEELSHVRAVASPEDRSWPA